MQIDAGSSLSRIAKLRIEGAKGAHLRVHVGSSARAPKCPRAKLADRAIHETKFGTGPNPETELRRRGSGAGLGVREGAGGRCFDRPVHTAMAEEPRGGGAKDGGPGRAADREGGRRRG